MRVSAKDAKAILENVPDDAVVYLDVIDIKTLVHKPKRTINVDDGEKLIDLSKTIQYEDNDFFGMMSLEGIENKFMVHNLLFPQIIST